MRSRLSRRDVELFAAVVDGRALGQREAAAFSDRLRDLVDVADFVRETSVPPARRDFVAALRAELMAAAANELASASPKPRRERVVVGAPPVRRRLTAAASTFIVAGGTLGLVAASAQAVPGDMLYPVKRATEKVELMFRDGSGEGRAILAHARTRLDEVEALAAEPGRDADGLISETLADFTDEANAGGALLLDVYREDGSTDEVETLRAFAAESAERLSDLAGSLPGSAEAEYVDAAQAISGIDSIASQACPTCFDGRPPTSIDDETLASVAYALDHMESRAHTDGPDSQPGRFRDGRSSSALPLGELDLPAIPLATDPGQPADDADDSGDTSNEDGDDPIDDGSDSDAVDDVEDTVDDTDGDLPTSGPSGVGGLVGPLTKGLDRLIDDPLGGE